MSSFLISSLVMSCTAGLTIISYASLAQSQGWAIGKLFKNGIFVIIFGGPSIIGTMGFAIWNASLLWGIGIFIISWVLAFILSFLLKSFVQWVAIILLISSWILQFFI